MTSCCSALAACPGLSVSLPSTHAYKLTESTYWSLQESSLTPSCFVTPHTSSQAAEAITILVSHHACSDTEFAIKGGTHAPAAGFANIDTGGVTIDMSHLSSISVNHDHSIAHVGAGATWLDAYTYLDPLGKSVAGGRNGAVGVGGLTLGGGISYFSPQVGFTCDTVKNFEVVLGDGKLVNANDKSNPELFRALKGGANNFGLVTRFDLETVDISRILGGSVVYDFSHRKAVFDAFANIAGAKHYDVHASIVAGLLFNSSSKEWTVSTTPIYTLPETSPKVYKELFSIPNISSTLELTHLHKFANETPIPPLNWQFWTGTYGVSSTLLDRMFHIINMTIYDFSVPEGILWSLAFEPLPTAFLKPGAGENSLGTSPADGKGMILLVSAGWADSASHAKVHQKAAELMEWLDSEAEVMALLKPFIYTNYAGWSQKPIHSYRRKNVEFLKRTAAKYDPKGVFQKKVPGGFKLP